MLEGEVEEVNSWDLILWPQHKINYKAHMNIQILTAQKRQSCFLTTFPHRRTVMPEGPKIYLHLWSPTRPNANLTMQGTANTLNTIHWPCCIPKSLVAMSIIVIRTHVSSTAPLAAWHGRSAGTGGWIALPTRDGLPPTLPAHSKIILPCSFTGKAESPFPTSTQQKRHEYYTH